MWVLRTVLHPAKRRRLAPTASLVSPLASTSTRTTPPATPQGEPIDGHRRRIHSAAPPRTVAAVSGTSWRTGGVVPPSLFGRSAASLAITVPARRPFSTSASRLTGEGQPKPTPLNEAQVPLISPHLRAQLFPSPSSPFFPRAPSPEAIKISTDHLQHHQLLPDPSSASTKKLPSAIEFDLPRLQGPTITHHFHALGRDVAEPYLSLARSFVHAELPPMPAKERWVLSPGWTFYSPDGSSEAVPYPPESDETMVFDVETLPLQGGAWAVMAVAVGKSGWYAWCSPWLTGDDSSPNHLIPYGPYSSASPPSSDDFRSRSSLFERADSRPRLLIGHNVLYDRARVAQEYDLRRPSTRYLDTLSLHVAVSGLTNPQRPTWLKYRKDKDAAEAAKLAENDEPEADEDAAETEMPAIMRKAKERSKGKGAKATDWKDVASVNSLAEVARLHCGMKVDKSLRNVFIDPSITISDIREHFVDLVDYCARDVETTLQVYRAVFPKFLESCPHPATFAGVTLMSQPVLPVDRKWPEYLQRAEQTYQERLAGVVKALNELAEDARAKLDERGEDGRFVWEDDLWLRQLDWSPKRARRLPGDVPAKQRTKKQIEQAARELEDAAAATPTPVEVEEAQAPIGGTPTWKKTLADKLSLQSPLVPLLLETTWRGFPVVFTHSHGWLFAVPTGKMRGKKAFVPQEGERLVKPAELGPKDATAAAIPDVKLFTLAVKRGSDHTRSIVSTQLVKKVRDGVLSSPYEDLATACRIGNKAGPGDVEYDRVLEKLRWLADEAMLASEKRSSDIFLRQLDWTPVSATPGTAPPPKKAASPPPPPTPALRYHHADLVWPKWYWDLDTPGQGLDVSTGKRAAPLLLKLKWKGFPVAYSKQHGWLYRIPIVEFDAALKADSSLKQLDFTDVADMSLCEDVDGAYVKLPHPDGEGKNVGSPLSKPFVAAFEEGILTSEYAAAEAALALNASCSYWTSARERITSQMVVWEGDAKTPVPTPAAIDANEASADTRGLILPQVLPMGTITRRSVERTWLTASNAKKNRVGSELKSMVRAPPGFCIVGADVDSEELWICSVMGDAQFGVHGATAIGWMTLEGTKSAGTDLHSKSASILGISRDDAKVFNYSRIYGAGVKHAVVLLLKSNPGLSVDEATSMAQKLYASTKGLVDRTPAFKRNFWHGGTESFVFNKLEQIAKSERPRTPALGCGLTAALTKANLPADGKSKAGEGYLPSRINWVVQSSGVDYLHLLLVSMEYLTKRFEIDARYLISVHDEVRYLVKEEDKERAAMALQVANVWTRSLFAYRLQMPDLPQGCAFFSAVDIDSCFRKEVNMPCTTPSNPDAIPFGESLEITDSLARTSGGSLFADGRSMVEHEPALPLLPLLTDLADADIQGEQHRVDDISFLLAQTASSATEIGKLWRASQDAARRKKLGFDPLLAPLGSKTRRKTPAPTAAAAEATATATRRRKSLRYDDDAELLPTFSSASTGLKKGTAPAPARAASAVEEELDEDDDDEDFGRPDLDDFYESLIPDEHKRKMNIYTPASRAQV